MRFLTVISRLFRTRPIKQKERLLALFSTDLLLLSLSRSRAAQRPTNQQVYNYFTHWGIRILSRDFSRVAPMLGGGGGGSFLITPPARKVSQMRNSLSTATTIMDSTRSYFVPLSPLLFEQRSFIYSSIYTLNN